MAFDATDAYDLAYCEIRQRRETGHDVGDADERLAAIDRRDRDGLLALYDMVAASPRSSPWPYEEPDDLAAITATLPAQSATPVVVVGLEDRILGGWLGRISGCNLGKPVERGAYWTRARLRAYLELAGAYPLRDYIPALDPMPEGFSLHPSWPETTRGRVDGSARDDDIDYAILGLHLLERHGADLQTEHVAAAWLARLPFHEVFTAERVAYRNLVDGLPLDQVATFRNPYREWIGAQIRGDAFGWTHPGDPRAAALAAHVDARLSHIGNGIYGEMWAAALIAGAFTADSPRGAVLASLEHVPPRSRLAEAVTAMCALHADGATWDDAIDHIAATLGGYLWIHAVPNAAIVAAGLLWGDGDFAATVGLTVQAGWDTDSNGATAGSAVGVLAGVGAIPSRFTAPLHDRVRSALFGFDNSSISDLAARTVRLALDNRAG